MKNHKKVYAKFFNISSDEPSPCERCLQLRESPYYRGEINVAVDVHHVDRRGMGGDQTREMVKDDISNLGGVCRYHHDRLDAYPEENEEFKKWCADLEKRKRVIRKWMFRGC